MEKKQKQELFIILASAFLLGLALILKKPDSSIAVFYFLPAFLLSGWEVIKEAAEKLVHGELLDEDFLMAAASIGALIIGEYPEAAAVMLLFRVGEWFEDAAVEKSRDNIAELSGLRPDTVRLAIDGQYNVVSPDKVPIGSTIEVRPGERISIDGTIIRGECSLDQSALTGESLPRAVFPGDSVCSGSVVCGGVLTIRTDKKYEDSAAARILKLVEESEENKSASETFVTRFARIYTPVVCILALLIMVIPSCISGEWRTWTYRGLLFLVVSCPCALVISVPLAFFAGIGGAARKGILMKGGNELEALAKAKIAAFDKTGTLTTGVLKIDAISTASGIKKEEFLSIAVAAESLSSHPIARCIAALCDEKRGISEYYEKPGKGVAAVVDGKYVLAGNRRHLSDNGIEPPELADEGTTVYFASDGKYIGMITVCDELKESANNLGKILKSRAGIEKTVLVTGDSPAAGEYVKKAACFDECFSSLLPEGKVSIIGKLQKQRPVLFVGDGINDAPVLVRADSGVAMGALGSDAAIEASGIVLMDDNPRKVADAIISARKTLRIAKENIAFAIGIKAAVLLLGVFGIASMWLAVFADVGVCVITVLNALRALRFPKN